MYLGYVVIILGKQNNTYDPDDVLRMIAANF